MKNVLILTGRYLPGYKDGGPLRTIINITEMLGDDYNIHIACLDRDHGDTKAYSNIIYNAWNKVGKAKVWYIKPNEFSFKRIINLSENMDCIYITSFFCDYGYKTLLLNKMRRIKAPVYVASMGVFAKEALAQGALKKNIFIKTLKMFGLFKNIVWSVTSELEVDDLKKVIGKDSKYIVAEDLPRNNVPGRSKKFDSKTMRVVFLSRICEHKGLDIAIKALASIREYCVFSIYGPIQEEEYWNKCRQLLEKSSISWKYCGTADTEKVQEILSNEDVLILPTKSENYGHVIFEALSVGCIPIISPNTPWTNLEKENAGRIVERSVEAFKCALLDVWQSDRSVMSKCAIRLAKEKVEDTKLHSGYRIIFG